MKLIFYCRYFNLNQFTKVTEMQAALTRYMAKLNFPTENHRFGLRNVSIDSPFSSEKPINGMPIGVALSATEVVLRK